MKKLQILLKKTDDISQQMSLPFTNTCLSKIELLKSCNQFTFNRLQKLNHSLLFSSHPWIRLFLIHFSSSKLVIPNNVRTPSFWCKMIQNKLVCYGERQIFYIFILQNFTSYLIFTLMFWEVEKPSWQQRDNQALHEKYANTEFFLVRIFPYSEWIRRDTPYLSVFSPNAGKYGVSFTQ